MTDWRLVPSALILAPLGLKKTSQFFLRRGWNVSFFNLTCSNGPGSCHSAATLDTELTWSTWKTSKKYRHWKTASFLNSTRNIKVFKPFYGSLSTFSIVRFPFKGWTWIRTKSETFQRTSTSIRLRHVYFWFPVRLVSRQKTSVTRARFSLQKVILSSAKGLYEVLHGHNRTEKWTRNEGYLCLLLLH